MNQTEVIEQMIADGASMEEVIEAMEQLDEKGLPVPAEDEPPEGYIIQRGRRYLARRCIGALEPEPEKEVKVAFDTARLMADSSVAATSSLMNIHQKNPNWTSVDCPSLVDVLKEQNTRIASGDTSDAEAMLVNQAVVLEQAFTVLLTRAFNNSGQTLENYLRLALRCQNQARASLETLGHIKNPTVITRQMNVAQGHQQVNNVVSPAGDIKPAERTIGHDLDA